MNFAQVLSNLPDPTPVKPVCKCDPATWSNGPTEICDQLDADQFGGCSNCDHDLACHTPEPQTVRFTL